MHAALAAILLACAPRARGAGPATTIAASALAAAESVYGDFRTAGDRIAITDATGRDTSPDRVPRAALVRQRARLRADLTRRLSTIDSSSLAADDRRAFTTMRAAARAADEPAPATTGAAPPDCAYDARAVAAGSHGTDSLAARAYACYGWAQHHLTVDGETVDRLTILARLARTPDAEGRRRIFLALAPAWHAVNGDDGAGSPYRVLIARVARERGGASSIADRARALGVPADSVEPWLLAILGAWRAAAPDSLAEPWDWWWNAGRAARALDARVPRERLLPITKAVYGALGADVDSLRVHYDLAPRDGKTPVAFTTFGARPLHRHGAWTTGEPWIFATYRVGGLDNLNELLHETGHAVHIAAIRTRPAFADWPDSDPFTEGVADFIALEAYEPAWQRRWLGDSVPLADGLRARYAGVVLDVAWSLFELRMLRDPAADPNRVWTAIARDYLGVRPHPELSWWALRGQLVDDPGYMMNYALGAILIAAIRDRTRAMHGDFASGDSTWYGWVSPRLYRFGLERPTREVVEEFLGGELAIGPILADMGRLAPR